MRYNFNYKTGKDDVMKIKIFGNRKNPAIVLIHGAFCDYGSVMHFAKYLEDDFFLIVPTLDGHYPDSKDYSSAPKQARILNIALQKMEIENLAMIHGTSMGAVVALEMAKHISADNYFFDAGSFFKLAGIAKTIACNKLIKLSGSFKNSSADEILKNRSVLWFCGDNPEKYRDTVESIVKNLGSVTENTIKNIAESCYNYHLPHFDNEITKKFIFHFSDREPAHECKKRLEKKYPLARFSDYSGKNYCGFQTKEPELYAQYLKDIINNSVDM